MSNFFLRSLYLLLSDFSSFENWFDLPDFNRFSLPPIHFFTIYDWYIHFRFFFISFLAFLLVIKATVQAWVFTFLFFLRFAPFFGDLLRPSDSISLYFFILFSMVISCKFKMLGKFKLLIQIFSLSNNEIFFLIYQNEIGEGCISRVDSSWKATSLQEIGDAFH